jgi:hypothetical protein
MTEELTGILQSRGQEEGVSYVVIDSTRLNVPEYVLDWMANMKNPLRNGETVLYKKQQDREGGAWRLTKIRRPDKGSTPAAGPQVDQKSGILLSHYATGCTVRMANGDKTYALKNPFPKDIILPQKIEFTVDKQGFILGHRFYGKADVALQENLDRLNGPADGETVSPPGGELVKAPPQEKPQAVVKESLTTAHPLPPLAEANIGMCTLTIGGTINLQNYENLKVEISGPAAYRKEIILFLNDTLEMLGKKEPTTGGMIDAWKNRVLGGVGE